MVRHPLSQMVDVLSGWSLNAGLLARVLHDGRTSRISVWCLACVVGPLLQVRATSRGVLAIVRLAALFQGKVVSG